MGPGSSFPLPCILFDCVLSYFKSALEICCMKCLVLDACPIFSTVQLDIYIIRRVQQSLALHAPWMMQKPKPLRHICTFNYEKEYYTVGIVHYFKKYTADQFRMYLVFYVLMYVSQVVSLNQRSSAIWDLWYRVSEHSP